MGKPSNHPTGGGKLTQQHMEGVTDINQIRERHLRTGVLGSGVSNGRKPMFVTLTGDSFHEMLLKVQNIQGSFAGYSAKIRKRFANNPENLIRFLEKTENLREAVALGLVDQADLSAHQVEQMNLVDSSEAEERSQFEKWRARQRARKLGDDAFEKDEDANSVPSRSDPEAQPSFSRKKRTT